MRAFLAAILSVIAAGVLLIAYGLLGPRVAAAPGAGVVQYDARGDAMARPMYASERVELANDPYSPYGARTPMAYPAGTARRVSYDPYATSAPVPAPRRVVTSAPVARTSERIERPSGRDWTKTAMIIGGTTAAGAGVGAIFGGKKGALIGAAIGGGAGTLYEVKKH
jgi:hypothetical protein